MTARENFDKPRQVEVVVIKPNKQALGKAFKQKAKDVQATLENLCDEPALKLKVSFQLRVLDIQLRNEISLLNTQNKEPPSS